MREVNIFDDEITVIEMVITMANAFERAIGVKPNSVVVCPTMYRQMCQECADNSPDGQIPMVEHFYGMRVIESMNQEDLSIGLEREAQDA